MRALILATDIYTRGGIARYTCTFASALADLLGPEKVDVLALLAYGDAADLRPSFRVLGPVTDRLTSAAKVRFAIKALALARNKYDLVVCSHLALAPVAATLRFVYRTPFWVVCHGAEVWGPPSRLKRVALRKAQLLLSVSRFTAEKLSQIHQVPAHQVAILHNAVSNDCERLLTAPAGAGGPLPRERILLSVGSLAKGHAYKGFDTAIRALPLILKRVPNLRYVIVGEGDDRPRLEGLTAKLQLGDCVTFTGSVSDAQLAQHYRSCEVFLLPSKTTAENGFWEGEGFGRVYAEAALAGKPVVGSRGGGAAEAVIEGKTGLLVDPLCIEEIAQAVIALLEQPERSTEMGTEGRRWALDNFTEHSMRRSLLGVLRHQGFELA